VLIHLTDGFERADKPWVPDKTYLSASLIYAAQRANPRSRLPTFNGGVRGLILRPHVTRVVCGCASDCGGTCVNAYGRQAKPNDEPVYCDATAAVDPARWVPCVWRPGRTFGTLFARTYRSELYNEIVVSGSVWAQHLPASVEAIVGDERARAAFLREYAHAVQPVRPGDFPAVRLDLTDFETPFKPA
jgi:hypothetical protein